MVLADTTARFATPLFGRRCFKHSEALVALPLPDHADAGAALVIVGHTDRAAVVLRSVTTHPEHALLGFRLPAQFDAMTVFAPSVLTTTRSPRHRPGSLAVRMTRSGETETQLAYEDGTVTRASAPQGWLIDGCRRALGLATDPPLVAPGELAIVLWLDRLMTALVRDTLDWPGAVALAPIPARWRSHDPTQVGVMLARNLPSWAAMRRSMVAGEPGPVSLPRPWARWMDDGMFARWCVGSFPDVEALRADIEFLAPAPVAAGVAQALRAAAAIDE